MCFALFECVCRDNRRWQNVISRATAYLLNCIKGLGLFNQCSVNVIIQCVLYSRILVYVVSSCECVSIGDLYLFIVFGKFLVLCI